jgi:hypothetical protein
MKEVQNAVHMVATVLHCPVGITWPTKAKAYVNPS